MSLVPSRGFEPPTFLKTRQALYQLSYDGYTCITKLEPDWMQWYRTKIKSPDCVELMHIVCYFRY